MDIDEGHHLPTSGCFHGGAVSATVPEIGLLYYFNSCADESEDQESWGSRSELYVCSL